MSSGGRREPTLKEYEDHLKDSMWTLVAVGLFGVAFALPSLYVVFADGVPPGILRAGLLLVGMGGAAAAFASFIGLVYRFGDLVEVRDFRRRHRG